MENQMKLTKQEVKALKEKMMPGLIEEAIANGYTGWQAEYQAEDYFNFFLLSTEQFVKVYNSRVRQGIAGAIDQEFIIWMQLLSK